MYGYASVLGYVSQDGCVCQGGYVVCWGVWVCRYVVVGVLQITAYRQPLRFMPQNHLKLLVFSDPNVPTVLRTTKLDGFNDAPYLPASKNIIDV